MEQKIIEVLNGIKNRAITPVDIYKEIYQGEEVDDFKVSLIKEKLRELQTERKVYCTNSRKELFMISPYKTGVVDLTKKKYGFIILDDEDLDDVYVSEDHLNGSLDGDKVLVKIITVDDRKEGRISQIIERKPHVGEVVTINRQKFIKVNNTCIKAKIPNNLVDGMKVVVDISKTEVNHYFTGEIQKVLGHKDDPNTDIKEIMVEYDFHEEFPLEVTEELKYIPNDISNEDITRRRDLRDKEIFTIDGDDTKDIDDAVSLEMLDNGHYLLGVHIADVTHYVKEGSALDKEATIRGTSAYLADRVVPMYPHQLSNGICSLNPEVDRLALSCEMEIEIDEENATTKVISYDVFNSVIHSRKQMTYKEVNKILESDLCSDDYKEYEKSLKNMYKLSLFLRKQMVKRGYLEFDSLECKIKLDENGNPIAIEKRTQGAGEELIEMFMIVANESVAQYATYMGLNFMYRVHDIPDEKRLREVVNIIKNQNGSIPSIKGSINPKDIQKILSQISNNDKKYVLNSLLLRCMAKAKYDVVNIGHYGIGSHTYCHFTSPIRRYPDTTVHRVIKSILNNNMDKYTTSTNLDYLEKIAIHSSKKERDAESCEREVNKMEMASYMSDKIGEEYDSIITGFTGSGMFVMLQNLVEGKVSFSTMDDYYVYNKELEAAVGEKSNKIYYLGDDLRVKLVKASKKTREIDFEMVRAKKRDVYGNSKQKSKI